MTDEERREKNREYHAANREKIKERKRKWRAANIEEIRKRERRYQAANKKPVTEKTREYHREYRAKNSEKVREYHRGYYAANKDPQKIRESAQKWRAMNPEKVRASLRKWRIANPDDVRRRKREWNATEKGRDYILRKKFGITLDDYNEMLSQQEGRCAICGKHHSEFKRALAVDHDHKTGKVRGLLCSHCNTTLGIFQDKTSVFEKAIQYLRQHINALTED